VIDAGTVRHQVPLLRRPALDVRRNLAEGEVVMTQVSVGGDAAVEAHVRPLASTGNLLELGHALEAQHLGPELVRDLHVADVEDQVIDAAGSLSLVGHGPSSYL